MIPLLSLLTTSREPSPSTNMAHLNHEHFQQVRKALAVLVNDIPCLPASIHTITNSQYIIQCLYHKNTQPYLLYIGVVWYILDSLCTMSTAEVRSHKCNSFGIFKDAHWDGFFWFDWLLSRLILVICWLSSSRCVCSRETELEPLVPVNSVSRDNNKQHMVSGAWIETFRFLCNNANISHQFFF